MIDTTKIKTCRNLLGVSQLQLATELTKEWRKTGAKGGVYAPMVCAWEAGAQPAQRWIGLLETVLKEKLDEKIGILKEVREGFSL